MKISQLKGGANRTSEGIRVGNFLIDGFAVQMLLYPIYLVPNHDLMYLLALLVYPAYYIFFEYYFQRTPGKYVTGTIVIDDYGNKPDFKTIIKRSFIRLIPFEPFSYLDGRRLGWHDTWTGTCVIKKESLAGIQERLSLAVKEPVIAGPPASVNMTKGILIAVIVAAVMGAGYFAVRELRNTLEANWLRMTADDRKMDPVMMKMICGEWSSDWKVYRTLNFKNDSSVTAVNRNGEKFELTYGVELKLLKLKDDSDKEFLYIIADLTEMKMTLIDPENMMRNIEFNRIETK